MKKTAKGLRVTVHFPDGRDVTYSGDDGDEMFLTLNKKGSDTVDNMAYCSWRLMAHGMLQHFSQNPGVARLVVREFISQDLPRLIAGLKDREEEGGRELTLDTLLGMEDPKKGTSH